jgi:hypothetical protein
VKLNLEKQILQQPMTTIIAYQTIGDAALKGAIKGVSVCFLVFGIASFLWFCRQWRKWFATNTFMRIVFPLTTLLGLLTWIGVTLYHDGGWEGVKSGVFVIAILGFCAGALYLKLHRSWRV